MKKPSPATNPANQCGSIVCEIITRGLSTGTTDGKANFSKIIFFLIKMILLKLTKTPPPGGGGLWLILAFVINLNSLKLS